MSRNLFVGSLSYGCTEADLRTLFEKIGEVKSAKIITDRETNRSRGFGFVEMVTDEAGETAVRSLDTTNFGGRQISVRPANPRPSHGAPRRDAEQMR